MTTQSRNPNKIHAHTTRQHVWGKHSVNQWNTKNNLVSKEARKEGGNSCKKKKILEWPHSRFYSKETSSSPSPPPPNPAIVGNQ
jgi:hypothetical protein